MNINSKLALVPIAFPFTYICKKALNIFWTHAPVYSTVYREGRFGEFNESGSNRQNKLIK